jgi:hypothetical protein
VLICGVFVVSDALFGGATALWAALAVIHAARAIDELRRPGSPLRHDSPKASSDSSG